MNVAIIPARGGSRRIPMKNIKPFHGKPILAYSIEAAVATNLFDRVYVSTDSAPIGILAQRLGATPLWRPHELARDEVGTQEVARHALAVLQGVRFACCIYATAPLMTPGDLITGFRFLVAGEYDFVYATDAQQRHAGQFYWGSRAAFLEGRPLEGPLAAKLQIPAHRVCDINTPADWAQAEYLYQQLRRNDADTARASLGG